MQQYTRPPRANENVELVAQRLKEATEGGGANETVTVEWNGRPLHVGVIDMPLRDLYYNPATHRIRAQRGHDPALERTLLSDPWRDESQEYLNRLLVGKPSDPDSVDPDFVALMNSLAEVDQQEPGLITHEGVLVNGNTRAAALRELKKPSIRVGVLPPSFTWEDINAVELSLQLRPDKRRDYSYINRLLAMEEQELMGRAAEDIARAFHIQVKTFKQERWILGVIQDMIERSRTGGGAELRLVDFEGHQENFKELHRSYTSAASHDVAEQIKENRIIAIILEAPKTKTRLIRDDFQGKYLEKVLPASFSQALPEAKPVSIPGLNVSAAAPSRRVTQARAITDQILKMKATSVSDWVDEEVQLDAAREVDVARKWMNTALDEAERAERLAKIQQTASERINEACAAINQSIADVAQARASNSLDEEGFDKALIRLRGSLEKLTRQVNRGLENPGRGVQWLTRAVTEERA